MTPPFSLATRLSWLGLAAALGLTACGEDGSATGAVCPTDGSTLTYENWGKAFMQQNCLACHSGKENPNLSTLDNIKANKDEIDRQAASGPDATNTAMPEGGSVSTEERKKLGEWLACGAP